MGYNISEKALAIHRVLKLRMKIENGGIYMELTGRTQYVGSSLMESIRLAFKVWEQGWTVRQEGLSLSLPTDVQPKPGAEYYSPPKGLAPGYARAYDIIDKFNAQWDGADLSAHHPDSGAFIMAEGEGIAEKANSIAGNIGMEASEIEGD